MRPSSKPDDPSDTKACRSKALDLLARREHARAELDAKLQARGFERSCVEFTLDQLAAERLQDDARFAEAFVRARMSRGQGPLRIRAELKARGLNHGLAEEALAVGERRWVELAGRARAKRFGFDPPADLEDRDRQRRFLEARGFSGAHIKAALDLTQDSD